MLATRDNNHEMNKIVAYNLQLPVSESNHQVWLAPISRSSDNSKSQAIQELAKYLPFLHLLMVSLPWEALAPPNGYMLHRQLEQEDRSEYCEENLWVSHPDSAFYFLFYLVSHTNANAACVPVPGKAAALAPAPGQRPKTNY